MNQTGEERPPILGSWGRLYAVILAYLAVLILLFDVFARSYNR